jgi:hypothetical protein
MDEVTVQRVLLLRSADFANAAMLDADPLPNTKTAYSSPWRATVPTNSWPGINSPLT